MASTVVKKYCTKCREGRRLAAVTCNGCHQLFCATCIVEHQQELAAQIDDVNREHDSLKQQLNRKYDAHVILSRINVWKKESIVRIQAAAEAAWVNLQAWTYRNIDIVNEIDEASTIHLIKIKENRNYQQSSTFIRERFDKAIGAMHCQKMASEYHIQIL
jgi:hypothetical protein